MKRFCTSLLWLPLLCVATTCHAPVKFDIRGALNSGVVFGITDLTDENRVVVVDEVIVGEVDGEEVWHVSGRAETREIAYGQAVAGLAPTVGPKPLRPNARYYVVLRGESGWRREAWGTCQFAIDRDGTLEKEEGC